MNRTILSVASFILAAGSLHAQSIVGTWQGTLSLPNGRNSRVVYAIEKNSDGSLHGGMTFIDQGAAVPLSSISFTATDVTLTQSASGITYRGKLSADGKSIAGSWGQAAQTFPLTLQLATADTLWKREGAAALPPMAATADPSYEVATIKPALPEEQHPVFDLTARQFKATGTSAAELIKIAYKVRGRQLINGPSWLDDHKFDIVAEPDTPGLPSEEQSRAMVHKLLNERFHLVSHLGQQDYPVMALTLDPKGPRPTPSDPNYNLHGDIIGHRDGDEITFQFSGVTMQQFLALIMNYFQDKQLVDATGLSGIYDITLRMPASAFEGADDKGVNDGRGPAMVAAAEHVGFKFVSKKEPIPVVIIDHIDPPTPN